MEYVAIASSVMSALGAIQQGQVQKQMYELQASQADLKARRDALQAEQQANMVWERMIQANASASATAFSGGVHGLSGSAKLIQTRNTKTAGRDINILQENAKQALSWGEIQADMLNAAGEQAANGAFFDAFAKLGTAAYMYDKVSAGGGIFTRTGPPAPVEEMSRQLTTLPSFNDGAYGAVA